MASNPPAPHVFEALRDAGTIRHAAVIRVVTGLGLAICKAIVEQAGRHHRAAQRSWQAPLL